MSHYSTIPTDAEVDSYESINYEDKYVIQRLCAEVKRQRAALRDIASPLAPAGQENATPSHDEVVNEYTRRVAVARATLPKNKFGG